MEALRILGCIALVVFVAIWTISIFWIGPYITVPKSTYLTEVSTARLVQFLVVWVAGFVAAGVAAAMLIVPPYLERIWRLLEAKKGGAS